MGGGEPDVVTGYISPRQFTPSRKSEDFGKFIETL
jgi:hypothetical protein